MYWSETPKTRFYTKEQIINAINIRDNVSGEQVDVFNLGPALPIILGDFDGCPNRKDLQIRFNQLVQKTTETIESLEQSSYRQTYHEIKGLPL
jgi:hypothetical protein